MERIETTEAIIKDGNFTLEKDVGVFEHFLSDDECDAFIALYENRDKKGYTYNRQDSEDAGGLIKTDTALSISFGDCYGHKKIEKLNADFVNNFWDNAIKKYGQYYPMLLKIDKKMWGYKIQKTIAGEGYHIWHCEDSSPNDTTRILTYTIYLNDDFTGGETELLHKNMRLTPKKGTLAIFPANYTHTHRGNPPLTGEKYIMTSWVHLSDIRV
jgi:Rps23 Pro-64 3,4-dihydroxylase Tpa1-like proline 4-hydroxylase